ncbi:MAG: hypothetical protein LBK99_18480, partial [Opitutaceae bacterium]|nr:hypothetical protein [Opitutaceae bacterium]
VGSSRSRESGVSPPPPPFAPASDPGSTRHDFVTGAWLPKVCIEAVNSSRRPARLTSGPPPFPVSIVKTHDAGSPTKATPEGVLIRAASFHSPESAA